MEKLPCTLLKLLLFLVQLFQPSVDECLHSFKVLTSKPADQFPPEVLIVEVSTFDVIQKSERVKLNRKAGSDSMSVNKELMIGDFKYELSAAVYHRGSDA